MRVGVVGAGAIARVGHLPALRALGEEVALVGAFDVDEGAVRSFCADAGVPRAYTDLGRMLAEQRPDLVVVCTPPAVHAEQTVAALRAGAWVWCEKPPCRSLAEYDAMAAAEGGPGGPYAAIVFQHRFGSGAEHVRGLIARGAFGRPLVAHCQTTWYRDAAYYAPPGRGTWAAEGGGTTMGHGIHQIDLMLDLLGPWAEVRAMAGRLVHDVETEDVSTALVRFASGALATVVTSAVSPDQTSRIRIDCERATIELTHLYQHANKDWRITPAPGVPPAESAAWQDMPEDAPSSHLPQLRSLVASLRAGNRPRASGADGRTSLELVTALYKAAATGGTVKAGEIGPGDPFHTALGGGAHALRPTPGEERRP